MQALLSEFELSLRRRLRTVPFYILILSLSILAAALVPPSGAAYAVINIGGLQPDMSASTALLAAGFVMTILVIAIATLQMGIWSQPDKRTNLYLFEAVSPANTVLTLSGKIFANVVGIGITILAVTLIFSATIALRYNALPTPAAYFIYFIILVPALLYTLVGGLILDGIFPGNPALRSLGLFILVIAAVGLTLSNSLDILGYDVMRAAIGEDRSSRLAFGFIQVSETKTIEWQNYRPNTMRAALGHMPLALLFAAGLTALLPLTAWWRKKRIVSVNYKTETAKRLSPKANLQKGEAQEISKTQPLTALHTGQSNTFQTVKLTLLRLFRRTKLFPVLSLICILLGVAGAAPIFSLTLIYLGLYLIYNKTAIQDVVMSRTFERAENSYAGLSSSLMNSLALSAVSLLALTPTLLKLDPLHALTAVLGVICVIIWFEITFLRLDFPILGTAIFGLLYYIIGFNDLPSEFDILGLRNSNTTALSFISIVALILLSIMLRRSKR
ncbi:hypothetical protein [Litorimonas sp. WD9-15]|uniref:hypothetical protein n=1 Tax=Litorimonas sp. WD9-15 TaxID=3418716 RepID=UPI003CFD0157